MHYSIQLEGLVWLGFVVELEEERQ